MDIQKTPSTQTVSVDVIEQLKSFLATDREEYPQELIEQILAQKDLVTPKLLAMVQNFVTTLPRFFSSNEWLEGMFALFILAKFKEQKVYPYLIQLCNLPHKTIDEVFDVLLVEEMYKLLASTFNGDSKSLHALISNQHLNEFARDAALQACITLYKYDKISREEVLTTLKTSLTTLSQDFSMVPTSVVWACSDIHASEFYSDIKRFFELELVDQEMIDLDEIDKQFVRPKSDVLQDLSKDGYFTFIDDLEEQLEWAFSQEDDEEDCDQDDDFDLEDEEGCSSCGELVEDA